MHPRIGCCTHSLKMDAAHGVARQMRSWEKCNPFALLLRKYPCTIRYEIFVNGTFHTESTVIGYGQTIAYAEVEGSAGSESVCRHR